MPRPPQITLQPGMTEEDLDYERKVSEEVYNHKDYKSGSEDVKRDLVGNFIYSYVENWVEDEKVPKIVGMILGNDIQTVISRVLTLRSLRHNVDTALKMVNDENEQEKKQKAASQAQPSLAHTLRM